MARPFAEDDYDAYLNEALRPVRQRWPETGEAISTPQPVFLGGWVTVHVHRDDEAGFETYVTSDVVALTRQLPSPDGFFELLMTCDDQQFAQWAMTQVAQLGEEQQLKHGAVVEFTGKGVPLPGVVLERFATFEFRGEGYALFLCHGCTQAELELAKKQGLEAFIDMRKRVHLYPRTAARRPPSGRDHPGAKS
jgi:hypothetical protein